MSLYLKYRPFDFKNVVGQDVIVKTLKNALKNNKVTHAYLFGGSRGTGKTSLARIMAKSLNCLEFDETNIEPCNQCEICTGINKGGLVDVIEIDAASNNGVDEIRELREKIVFTPTQAKVKIYIIDEVHMLSKPAFNALLKTLEEPPEHAYFILATTEIHKIPETIISRCQQFTFKRIGIEDTVSRLKIIAGEEGITAEEEALLLIAKVANGGLRDAIGMLEQMNVGGEITHEHVSANLGMSEAIVLENFYNTLLDKKPLEAIEIINQVNIQGKSLHQFSTEFIYFLREKMLISLKDKESTKVVLKLIDFFTAAKAQINQSLIPQLPLEMAVVKSCEGFIEESIPSTPKPKKEEVKKVSEKPTESNTTVEPNAVGAADLKPTNEGETTTPQEITISSIQKNWQRILDHIETPFIRMSFVDGRPVRFEDGDLYMEFNSNTFMEKVAKKSNQAIIQKAFETVLGSTIELKLDLKKIDLKTGSEEEKTDHSVIEMAQEVFGDKKD